MAAKPEHQDIESRVRSALRQHGSVHPSLLVLAAGRSGRVREGPTSLGMELASDGYLLVDPTFAGRVDDRVLAGAAFHVLLHPTLRHASRRCGRDETDWWVACDAVLNEALLDAGLALPSRALRIPCGYKGPRQAEPLYEWLRSRRKRNPSSPLSAKKGGNPSGCASHSSEADGNQDSGEGGDDRGKRQSGETAGVARGCGTGASLALEEMFAGCLRSIPDTPAGSRGLDNLILSVEAQPPRVDWRRLLRWTLSAPQVTGYSNLDWSRPNYRRQTSAEIILPRWRDREFRLGIIVDVSGSMRGTGLDQVIAEARALVRAYPRVRVWLAAHTDRLCYSAEVRDLADAVVEAAFSFTGGTDPTSTYEAARRAGRFHALVHFTDRQFFCPWPAVPSGTRLVVGDCPGLGSWKVDPPIGTLVVACTQPGDGA